ncbi:hypothetical protein [Vibrio fluminensis]|nr:hypothetical protein [Vibrio fluminensis]
MKAPNSAAKPKKNNGEATDEKVNNIHQVRRRIEDILLEREQKKHLEL